MKKFNMTNVRRSAKRIQLSLKKHAPQIMVAAGAAGTVTAAVMACKNTLKLEETLDECKEDLGYKQALLEAHQNDADVKEYQKDVTKQYFINAYKVGKLYAPSVALGAVSLGLIFGGQGVMCKRNANLAAAYATLDQMFKKYRKNVVDMLGEEADMSFRYGHVEEAVNKKGETEKVLVVDPKPDELIYSDYSRFFGPGLTDKYCEESHAYNIMFLNGVRDWANWKLRTDHFLFLNDVYEQLGFELTKAGFTVGWIYDKENPVGDNEVKFGMYDTDSEATKRFINGLEDTILLDFNVDGDILHSPLLQLSGK